MTTNICTKCNEEFRIPFGEYPYHTCPKCRAQSRNYYKASRSITSRKDPYEELAHAIVLQAVKDWRTAYRAAKRSYGMYSQGSWNRVYDRESFFRSEWFRVLTNDNIDGKLLIKRLRKEEDERWNRSHKQT